MEIVAHGLWASLFAILSKRSINPHIRVGWTVSWAALPDVLAFGPPAVAGTLLKLAGGANAGTAEGHILPHVHVGLPLYQAGHSLIVFLLVFGLAAIVARRVVFELLGWLLHIAIDIPTHSLSYYATRFLWPVSDYRIDGIAWWTPWLWATTYGALAVVFFLVWRGSSSRTTPVLQLDSPRAPAPQYGTAIPIDRLCRRSLPALLNARYPAPREDCGSPDAPEPAAKPRL